jgi:hypothetical protein
MVKVFDVGIFNPFPLVERQTSAGADAVLAR